MGDFSFPVSSLIQEEETGKGITLQYRGKYLYSKYRPIDSTEKTASSYIIEEETLYILGSPLLGHGVESFLNRVPDSSFVIGIELEQELIEITKQKIQSLKLNPNRFLFCTDHKKLYNKINELGLFQFKRIKLLSFNQGFKLNQKGYNIIHSNVISIFHNFHSNRATRIEMGNLWNTNIIRNLSLLSKGKSLNQLHTNKPVIITGAGESLERILPFLRKHGSKFFILCIDTAAPTLLEFEIQPDAILNLEGQFYNLYDFYPLKESKITIISDILSYPETLHVTGGKTYFFSTDFGKSTLLNQMEHFSIRPPAIPPLGSVGVAALKIAEIISDSAILISGLDFAYIPGKTHTNGSANHTKILTEWSRVNGDPLYKFSIKRGMISDPVLTSKNSALKSDRSLVNYANQLKTTAQSIKQPIYNLTDAGLDLGLPSITEKGALKLTPNSPKPKENTNQKTTRKRNKKYCIGDFIDCETEKLIRIQKAWKEYALGDPDGTCLKTLLTELQKVPYLYDHFPDKLPHPCSEMSFLTRALSNAGKLQRLYTINKEDLFSSNN